MVEIIPKKPKMKLPVENAALFIAGALLVIIILGYAILIRSEARGLLIIQDLEEDIFKVGDREDKVAEDRVFRFEEKIKDFKNLLDDRRHSSNFFNNFEGLIHPRVWFSSFELYAKDNRAVASGSAIDFKALEQQMIFFKSRDDLVESLELSGVVLGSKGAVDFNFTFNFTPKIFEK